MFVRKISLILGVLGLSITASAQMDEIIVTGSRIQSFERDVIPAISMTRKADFMVINAYVESDSRSAKLRRTEVLNTIDAVEEAAEDSRLIELGQLKEFETDDLEIEYVVPFSSDSIRESGLSSGYRADTSRVNFVIKTPIKPGDNDPESVYTRVEKFIAGIEVDGRAVVGDDGDMGLSIVDIPQYRYQIIKALVDDSKKINDLFGDDYRMSISGFDESVRWRVTGALTLTLYIPYNSSIHPVAD